MLTLDLVKNGNLTVLGPGYSYPERKDILSIKVELNSHEWEGNYHKSVYEMWKTLKGINYTISEETLKSLIDNFNEYGDDKYSEGDDNGYMSSLGESL